MQQQQKMMISIFNNEGVKGERYSFKQREVVIGRNPSSECSVVIDSHTISRNHLKAKVEQNAIHIQDQSSSNGTYLNEEKIIPKVWYAVQPNDKVKLAEFQGYLQFQLRESSTQAKHAPVIPQKKKRGSSISSSSSGDRSRSKQKQVELPFKISESTFRMVKDMTINKKSKQQRIKFLRLMGISKAAEYWQQIEKILKQKKGMKDKQETADNLQKQFNQGRSGAEKKGLGR